MIGHSFPRAYDLRKLIRKEADITSTPEVPRDGLFVEYTMDYISGTTIYDTNDTDTKYDGTISGATICQGAINNGLSFDGVDDYLSVDIAKPSIYSISGWVYGAIDVYAGFGRRSGNSAYNGQTWFRTHCCFYHNGISQASDEEYNASTGASGWNHYVMTKNGTSIKIWKNKIQTINGTLGTDRDTNFSNFYGPGQETSGYLSFKMDQVRFYNKALSMDEIEILYNEREVT